MIGLRGTKKKVNGHMRQIVGELNEKIEKCKMWWMVILIFWQRVAASPEISCFSRRNVWGQRWRLPHHHGRKLCQKSLLGYVYFLHGWGNAFSWKSVFAIPCSRAISKGRPLTVRTTDNICAGKLDHAKTATFWYAVTQTRPKWKFPVLFWFSVSRLVNLKRKLRSS